MNEIKKKKELCEKHGIKLFYITKRNYGIKEILSYINKDDSKTIRTDNRPEPGEL